MKDSSNTSMVCNSLFPATCLPLHPPLTITMAQSMGDSNTTHALPHRPPLCPRHEGGVLPSCPRHCCGSLSGMACCSQAENTWKWQSMGLPPGPFMSPRSQGHADMTATRSICATRP